MNKYINIKVAKEYLRHDSFDNPYFRSQACQQAMDVLDTVPAADVVEVVRCRECFYNVGESKDLWGNPVILCVTAVNHEPDWYCADGKRKDGGQDE